MLICLHKSKLSFLELLKSSTNTPRIELIKEYQHDFDEALKIINKKDYTIIIEKDGLKLFDIQNPYQIKLFYKQSNSYFIILIKVISTNTIYSFEFYIFLLYLI